MVVERRSSTLGTTMALGKPTMRWRVLPCMMRCCLQSLLDSQLDLQLPVRIFHDSQLLIHFMLQIYLKLQQHTIYWAIEDVKQAKWVLGRLVAYRHVTRAANCMADDMARRALAAKGDVTYVQGDVPKDASSN